MPKKKSNKRKDKDGKSRNKQHHPRRSGTSKKDINSTKAIDGPQTPPEIPIEQVSAGPVHCKCSGTDSNKKLPAIYDGFSPIESYVQELSTDKTLSAADFIKETLGTLSGGQTPDEAFGKNASKRSADQKRAAAVYDSEISAENPGQSSPDTPSKQNAVCSYASCKFLTVVFGHEDAAIASGCRQLSKEERAILMEPTDKFLEDFNPDNSIREKRKLNSKLNHRYISPKLNHRYICKKVEGAEYDQSGTHISTEMDMCDCLCLDCSGCYFPCSKCGSPKCGLECRVNRTFSYEKAEYEGRFIRKNPLTKNSKSTQPPLLGTNLSISHKSVTHKSFYLIFHVSVYIPFLIIV